MIKISDERIKKVSNESVTMARAAAKLGIHYNTFKKHAVRLNVFKPNPSGKGISKPRDCGFKLEDILTGKHPQYQTYKLKQKLYKKGIKKNVCEECGLSSWKNKPLECELEHIDGIRTNHNLKNLKILCPNCHSQTDTFRSKNIIMR